MPRMVALLNKCEHALMYVQARDAGVLQNGLLNLRWTCGIRMQMEDVLSVHACMPHLARLLMLGEQGK